MSTEDDESAAALERRLDGALSDVFHQADGSVVNRWIVLADVLGPQGERALHVRSGPQLMSWDTLGMLEFARQAEQAALNEHDD